jgi:hypothetical protein
MCSCMSVVASADSLVTGKCFKMHSVCVQFSDLYLCWSKTSCDWCFLLQFLAQLPDSFDTVQSRYECESWHPEITECTGECPIQSWKVFQHNTAENQVHHLAHFRYSRKTTDVSCTICITHFCSSCVMEQFVCSGEELGLVMHMHTTVFMKGVVAAAELKPYCSTCPVYTSVTRTALQPDDECTPVFKHHTIIPTPCTRCKIC